MRNLIILTVIFLSLINCCFAQLSEQARIDSLLKELPKMKEDTNGVNLFLNLSNEYSASNPDDGIMFGERGLHLAQRIEWKLGESKCYSAIGYNNISKSYFSKALEYFEKSLKISEELENEYRIADIFKDIGSIYLEQSNYTKALEYYHRSLKINEKLGNKSSLSMNYSNIGFIYRKLSNYKKALEFYREALKVNEELRNKRRIAHDLGNIGNTYVLQSEHSKALEYYQKSLKINEELKSNYWIANNLGNIGLIYTSKSDYDKALEYQLRSLKISEEAGNKSDIARSIGNIGRIYLIQLNYTKALEYYHRALLICEEVGDKSGIAHNNGIIGVIYFNISKDLILKNINNKIYLYQNKETLLNKAILYLKQSADIFEEIGEIDSQSAYLICLADAYELKLDYKNALETFKEYKTLQDSIFSMDKQKEFANLEAKRENELKDAEISILQTEKKAQQFQSYLLGGGVIVLFGAFGIAFIRFREKKKLSEKLALQKAEIENQKSIVEEKNEQITASITYASTIQNAILPWDSTLQKAFSEILIFYKPKDIVSGDSYWFQEINGIQFLAVIDCTGHGIPGAMLTVIASTALDDAVLGKRLSDTGQILTYMNEKVTEVLNQRLTENKIRDGMEVALIAIHKDKVQFSGAGRPLYMKNGTMEIIKTDKRGIAGQTDNDEYQFSSVDIEKHNNLMLYLTSDGFADQMNEHSKKYSTKRFVALLDSISEKPITEQNKILENEFNNHKGTRNQIDDVTILGVRI